VPSVTSGSSTELAWGRCREDLAAIADAAEMPAGGCCDGPGGVLAARAVALLARLAKGSRAVEATFGQGRVRFRTDQAALLLLSLKPGRLVLESGRAGAGCSRVGRKVPYQGRPVRVALEPRYVVELLRCLEGEPSVQVGLTDADTPVVLRAGDYVHVLMPLRLE
jgi:hypothetical protein